MKRTLSVALIMLVLLLCHGPVSAQTNLRLTGMVGDNRVTIGHLFEMPYLELYGSYRPVSVITGDGYVLYLNQRLSGLGAPQLRVLNYYANLDVSNQEHITHLYYNNSACNGQAFIDLCEGSANCSQPEDRVFDHRGHIEHVFGGDDYPVLYAVDWNALPSSMVAIGQRDVNGICTEIFFPFTVDYGLQVTVINPPNYGLTYNNFWYVADPQWQVGNSGAMFCSGFESCPQP